jgi:serine protease Do
MKRLTLLAGILILLLIGFVFISEQFSINITPKDQAGDIVEQENVKLLTEESVVIDAVEQVGPSVVTILEDRPAQARVPQTFGPFSFFGLEELEEEDPGPESIGSGFVVSDDGLIVTNKHVVGDPDSTYQILTNDDRTFDVERIYRDPLNDIAILKVNTNELKPVVLGNSDNLKVGQFVIAIGSALGEFRNSVTTGVVSGLGRGITAGSPFQGFVERLDNVIQTDAAINPGNSGGPLLNSSSQVIGVNTAVSAQGENIGFALPVNAVKESIRVFNEGGQFDRAFLGVSYRLIDPEIATLNEVAAGAYVDSVVPGSPAEEAGLKRGDIITEINGKRILEGEFDLSQAISENKIGDEITLTIWNNGETREAEVILGNTPDQ